jgi:hypothetical protein
MLEDHLVLLLVAMTTGVAYLLSRKVSTGGGSFQDALRKCMECVGAFLVFLSANMALGVAVILLMRSFTPRFVSVYALTEDLTLLILSAVQGVVFRLWWPD